jgi:dihydrofolate reductase
MNGLPKYVASRTLTKASWNNTAIIGSDLVGEVSSLKAQAGGNMLIYGSASIVHALMPQGLVDEYRLMVYPIVLGRGKRLFPPGARSVMTLAECRTFNDGIVLLRYAV